MTPAFRLDGVRKWFGPNRAVDGLSLAVETGQVVGFLGLNGAGKTTTMRMLAGLLRAEAGTLEVLGHDPWTMPPAVRRRIGYLSERDFPYPDFTFRAAAGFTASFFSEWDGSYLEKLASLLQVPATTPYSRLSRGQQRKFHLALTLAPKPDLLLLDDPAQGLDVTVRREFIQSILPLLQAGRSTVLFSSHILSDVERIADTVVIVHAGRLLLQRPLDELKEKARQVIVRGAGPMDLPGALRIRRSGNEHCFTVFDPAPGDLQALREKGASVELRPLGLEDFFIDVVEGARS
jgi:ABC-2 type transport system ATP-binding protein